MGQSQPPQFSPDGKSWWDGNKWVNVVPITPPNRPKSTFSGLIAALIYTGNAAKVTIVIFLLGGLFFVGILAWMYVGPSTNTLPVGSFTLSGRNSLDSYDVSLYENGTLEIALPCKGTAMTPSQRRRNCPIKHLRNFDVKGWEAAMTNSSVGECPKTNQYEYFVAASYDPHGPQAAKAPLSYADPGDPSCGNASTQKAIAIMNKVIIDNNLFPVNS